MACTLVAGTSSRQSWTVVLYRFADGEVVGEAHFPHRLTAPQSEQNSDFWGYALIGVRKRSDSLTLHHAHHCLFLIPCLYGERLAKEEVRNDRRLGLGDDLGRSRKF
jgi:hypothetical protein